MTTEYIDATPTEILKMARLADQFLELTRNVNETKRKKG